MKFVKKIVKSVVNKVVKIVKWAGKHEELILTAVDLGVTVAVSSTTNRVFKLLDPVSKLSLVQRIGRWVVCNVITTIIVKSFTNHLKKDVDDFMASWHNVAVAN